MANLKQTLGCTALAAAILTGSILLLLPERETPTPTPAAETVRLYDTKRGEVRIVSLEEYLIGCVAAEMPALYETEALKAQAVASRTYVIAKETCSSHSEANICTSAHCCQCYNTEEELKEKWGG